MKFKYKQLPLRTIRDFETAERLHAKGWKVISCGFVTVLLEKEVRSDKADTKNVLK